MVLTLPALHAGSRASTASLAASHPRGAPGVLAGVNPSFLARPSRRAVGWV